MSCRVLEEHGRNAGDKMDNVLSVLLGLAGLCSSDWTVWLTQRWPIQYKRYKSTQIILEVLEYSLHLVCCFQFLSWDLNSSIFSWVWRWDPLFQVQLPQRGIWGLQGPRVLSCQLARQDEQLRPAISFFLSIDVPHYESWFYSIRRSLWQV